MKNIGRIRVLMPNENEFASVCKCPHCGKEVLYGKMMKVNGINCCSNCNIDLHKEIEDDQKINYDLYEYKANKYLYEPYRFKGEI